MGQNRTDTANQRAVKQDVAERRRCRACGRRSAMSTRIELRGDRGERGSYKECLYCGHVVARYNGERYEGDAAAHLLEDFS